MLKCLRLVAAAAATFVSTAGGQEIASQPGTVNEPREAFFENAPLAEAGFAEARFNRKEQRLREHYLSTPLGVAPQDNAPEAAPPSETDVGSAAEAGLGVSVVQNRALSDGETNNSTSNVCEPSLAVRGQEILYTGNWFAAFSRNGGATFSYRNPETTFPTIPNRPFCCDQVALYVPSHDLMVWFLQHGKDTTGNTVRLAVAKGADIAAERWRFYDFTPQSVGNWTGEWFDYPDLAYSNQHLFVTTNSFTLADAFARSVAMRIPLNELANYAALNYRHFNRTDVGSLRPTQGTGNTMYIGTHANTASIRMYAWADGSNDIQTKNFAVQSWVRGGASAPCPDGRDWLGSVDGRITAAWSAGDTQGFAWTSAQGGNFPFPHVRVAVLNFGAGTVTSQPHIWNQAFAFAYPGAAANPAGRVGMCLSYGGGATLFPNPAVGVQNGATWSLAATGTGTHGPDRNRWGDYQTVRLNGQNTNRFAAAEFSLSGGPARTDIVARLVQFEAVTTEAAPTPAGGGALLAMSKKTPTESPENHAILAEASAAGKFSKETFNKNQARQSRARAASRAVAQSLGQALPSATAIIALDGGKDLDQFQEDLKLPDIGAFFFESAESVCEPDNRLQVSDTSVAPWNGNCQLIITMNDGGKARGTGWFMTPDLVVTAGHCVHEGPGGNFFQSIEVIPGMNGPTRPFSSQSLDSTHLRASAGWSTTGAVIDDYGAIRLDAPFVGVTSTPAAALSDGELGSMVLTLSGYPADLPTGTQWFHSGPATAIQARRLLYQIDTFGGHSGSAVTATTATGRVAVGIHNYGGCPNKCSRITPEILANLNRWADEK